MVTASPKITFQVDPDLLYLIKMRALEQDRTLRDLLNEALLNLLKYPAPPVNKSPVKIGGYHLGKIKGKLTREEIYDYL